MTAPTPAPVVLLPLSDDVLDQIADRVAERLSVSVRPESDEPLYLTGAKLCAKLGISKATLYRARKGGMSSVRVGDEHRYLLASARAHFEGRAAK